MIDNKRDYQRFTAWVHLGLAAISLLVAVPFCCLGQYGTTIGFFLSACTNALIGWAKFDLMNKGKS
jgi:hypothetical protein